MCFSLSSKKNARIVTGSIYLCTSSIVVIILECFLFNWCLMSFSIAILAIIVTDILLSSLKHSYNTKWMAFSFAIMLFSLVLLIAVISTAVEVYWNRFPTKRQLMELLSAAYIIAELAFILCLIRHIKAMKEAVKKSNDSLVSNSV